MLSMKVNSIQNFIRWYTNITRSDIIVQGLELFLPQGMFISEDTTIFILPVEDGEHNEV